MGVARRIETPAQAIKRLEREIESLKGLAVATRGALQAGLEVREYTPELTASVTNPTRHLRPGATVRGHYIVNGRLCTVWVYIRNAPDVGTAGEGVYMVSLPVEADSNLYVAALGVGAGSQIGSGAIRDHDSSSNNVTVSVQLYGDFKTVAFPKSSGGFVLHNSPFIFAGSDVPANFTAQYVIAV